jgi:uncharacterized protein (TIGR02996 family)
MSSDGEALLRAIHEAPANDDLRLVYADWLAERGDPRGEFIVLQFEGTRGPKPVEREQREARLERAHWKTWVGPLAPHLRKGQLRFARGFLEACCWRTVSRPKVAQVIGDPVWSTVEELAFSDGSAGRSSEADESAAHPVVPLIADRAMRSLRAVEGLGTNEMAALCTLDRPLRIERAFFYGHQPLDDNARGLLSKAASLPSLRTLGYVPLDPFRTTPAALRWVMQAPIARRLERLVVGEQSPLGAWHAELVRSGGELPSLEVVRNWNLQNRTQLGWRLALSRGRSGDPSVLRARFTQRGASLDATGIGELVRDLDSLPADALTELHVAADRPFSDADRASIYAATRRLLRLDRLEIA